MEDDKRLEGDDWEGQLQKLLAELPAELAPASLRQKLQQIPREQQALEEGGRWKLPNLWRPFLLPYAFAFSLVPIALASFLYWENLNQQQEIAQGKRDLVVALAYIKRANEQTNSQIRAVFDVGLSRPISNNTITVLQQPLTKKREYQL